MANVQIKQIEALTNDAIDKTKKLYSITSSENDTLLSIPLSNKEQDSFLTDGFDPEDEMLASKLVSDMDYGNMPDLTRRDSEKIFLTRTLKNNPQFIKGSFYSTNDGGFMPHKPNYSNFLGYTFTNEQKLAIRNGTFDGMNLGDYWILSDANGMYYIFTIVGFNCDQCISPRTLGVSSNPLDIFDGDPESEEPNIEVKYSRNARFTDVPENGRIHIKYRDDYKNHNHLYLYVVPFHPSSSIPSAHPLSGGALSARDTDASSSSVNAPKTYLETNTFAKLDSDAYTSALQYIFGDFLMPQCVGMVGQMNCRINAIEDTEHDSYMDVRWGYAFTPSMLNLGPIEGLQFDTFEYFENWFHSLSAAESWSYVDPSYGWSGTYYRTYKHAQFLRIGNPYLPGLSPVVRGQYGYNNYRGSFIQKQSTLFRDCIMFTNYYHAANISYNTYLINNANTGSDPSHIRMCTLGSWSQGSINSNWTRYSHSSTVNPYNIVKIGAEPIPAN